MLPPLGASPTSPGRASFLLGLPPSAVQGYLSTSSSISYLSPHKSVTQKKAMALICWHTLSKKHHIGREKSSQMFVEWQNEWTNEWPNKYTFGLACNLAQRAILKSEVHICFWVMPKFWNECIHVQCDSWKKLSGSWNSVFAKIHPVLL